MSVSNIEWTGHTWNPIVGCSLKSPGCTHCYAMGEAARQVRCADGLGRATHYEGTVEIVKGRPVWTGKMAMAPESILLSPLKRKKPTTYFVNSMGDLFHESVPDAWIDRVFAVTALTPQHTYQVLTKRAARMRDYLTTRNGMGNAALCKAINEIPANMGNRHGALEMPLPNVWLGVSAERQQEWDERKEHLRATPAAVRFASFEPLLGGIIEPRPMSDFLQWAIVGGESGPDARPMHPGWARSLRDQCLAAEVPFFFKQWGEWHPRCPDREGIAEYFMAINGAISPGDVLLGGPEKRPRWIAMERVGKKASGRVLDGREHNALPA